MLPTLLEHMHSTSFIPLLFIFLCLFLSMFMFKSKPSRKVYLIDFACFKPKASQQVTRDEIIKRLLINNLTQESIEYQRKILMSHGIGDMTYGSEALLMDEPDLSMEAGRREAEAALFGAVDELLAKTRVDIDQIGVLVVCCCLFNPAPSLTAMVVNKYKLRPDVKSYNLSGMGCSASIAAIDLAKHLLQANENMYAMVVSTEVVSPYFYTGNDTYKLAINCIMRVGGAAILLSNRHSDRRSSKYQLVHNVRTNTTKSDASYKCVFREEDSQGLVGINVNKDLLVEANKAVTAHITTVAKLVLPTSDKILFTLNYLARTVQLAKLKPYTPDFRRVIDHFFPHVGASIVIDQMERILKLDAEAPRMTLYRFGNLSSSTVWYELAYSEAKRRIKKGDCVWQVAFGSGFKCSSVIWRAMKNVDQERFNPWFGEIENFPVKVDLGPQPTYYEKTA